MENYTMWTVCTWTFKGILCTCRFLWICPYNAIKFLPREKLVVKDQKQELKPVMDLIHYDSSGSVSKSIAPIPGSPDRTAALHKRLTKTEREILSLKTRFACEKSSWERRFAELQRKQEELCYQLISEAGLMVKIGTCDDQGESGVDNGEVFDDSSSGLHHRRKSEVSSRSDSNACSQLSSPEALSSRPASSLSAASSVTSWRTSQGPHRVFVPHSPMDLQLGHRVRIMLPSGRISTGTVRFLGPLQGEADLHLGVELQTPDGSSRDGSHKGHSYFECKPGYGAFVPFHKLLMAWE